MDADQVGFALNSVVQAQLGKVAVTGVNIVEVDVLHRQRNNRALCNVLVRQQEQGAVAKEVLHVVQAENGLHGNFFVAQIVVSVQNVGKTNDLGNVLVHTRKLVQHLALRHSKRPLPCGLAQRQSAGAQEGIKLTQNLILESHQKSIVGLFHGHVSAVLGNGFQCYALGVLGDLDISVGDRLHLHFGERNLVTLGNRSAALQRTVNAGFVRHQLSARCLADRAHNAHNVAQRVPVVRESRYKIDLADGGRKLTGSGHIVFSSHSSSFLKISYLLRLPSTQQARAGALTWTLHSGPCRPSCRCPRGSLRRRCSPGDWRDLHPLSAWWRQAPCRCRLRVHQGF